MQCLKDVSLDVYTTIKIGGLCKRLWFPETEEEIIYIWNNYPRAFDYIIGNGSNLLIDETITYEDVICMRSFKKNRVHKENGHYIVDAGVSLQQLITQINADGYGGIEYLYSVPGTAGGAAAMNAGRGRKHNASISDFITGVTLFSKGEIFHMQKDACEFEYRSSFITKRHDALILRVDFEFEKTETDVSYERIKKRLEFVKSQQDTTMPNFGSVFKEYDPEIMEKFRKKERDDSAISYSNKTTNWIINKGGGNYADVKKRIDMAIIKHKKMNKPIALEVIDWGEIDGQE